ncbi:MAG: assimilatory sulfite reductase (NADPH) flavoprotein subunit [Vitreoscilla sp.]|nr:assimilatory sulfite reductase (NADPH) flavoprotein subunit [Vitreoscilla sp.]MBP9541322.1 assimilatory sulfite reductase (NADPH) flavoprotein subunit [Vitreoscilla sp.]
MTEAVLPLSTEWQQQLDQFSATQLAWLSGYCWARSQNGQAAAVGSAVTNISTAAAAPAAVARKITVLSASQTGNARRVAEQLLVQLQEAALDAQLVAAGDYKAKNIASEDILLIVASTQGEGEPAEEAVSLHKFLHGKKAPQLAQLSYAVLGLGDTSYPNYCQAGKDFDAALEKLGATRLAARVDCDLDFQAASEAWRTQVAGLVQELAAASAAPVAGSAPATSSTSVVAEQHYTKENPYSATLSVGQKITANDANKDVRHIEIDLADSGIHYAAGDALGVWFSNDEALVAEVLGLAGLSGDEKVSLANGQSLSIKEALTFHDELTQNTPQFIKGYAELSQNAALLQLVQDTTALQAAVDCTPIAGILHDYPHAIGAEQLHGLLRPLTPRMYSIASAQAEVETEVHLTVGRVAFEHHGQAYTGGASGFLSDRVEEGGEIKVFVEPNKNFRLPESGDTPIIMIGAGTGVAPFRAFIQQRDNNGDAGLNWLVFGNQKFTDDFLYQSEWLQYRKNGLLNKVSTAWSRQGKEKVYVQHKLRENAADVWQWLQNGAHVYVCGDALKMAKDVEQALLDIIAEHGNMSLDDADEYLSELRENKRYQRDVY